MKICVIGASKGIGLSLCRVLAAAGHDVWAAARSPIADMPQQIHRSAVDIRQMDSVRAWQQEMQAADWHPDCVVIAAGIQKEDMRQSYNNTDVHDVIDTNLEGPLRCVDVFLPEYLKTGKGSIIALCSTVALRPSTRSAAYAASKAGLAMAWRSLRARYSKEGVRFGIVYLGPVATEMWEGRKSILVPPADAAAQSIARFIVSQKTILYSPFLLTAFFRLCTFFPDRFVISLSRWLLKRR